MISYRMTLSSGTFYWSQYQKKGTQRVGCHCNPERGYICVICRQRQMDYERGEQVTEPIKYNVSKLRAKAEKVRDEAQQKVDDLNVRFVEILREVAEELEGGEDFSGAIGDEVQRRFHDACDDAGFWRRSQHNLVKEMDALIEQLDLVDDEAIPMDNMPSIRYLMSRNA